MIKSSKFIYGTISMNYLKLKKVWVLTKLINTIIQFLTVFMKSTIVFGPSVNFREELAS